MEITEDNFETFINEGIALVDFFAAWCGVCKKMGPIYEEIAKKLSGKINFATLDVEKNKGLAKKFDVTSIPTLILFKEGKEVDRLVGQNDSDAVEKFALQE